MHTLYEINNIGRLHIMSMDQIRALFELGIKYKENDRSGTGGQCNAASALSN